jgi:hypothetical protein
VRSNIVGTLLLEWRSFVHSEVENLDMCCVDEAEMEFSTAELILSRLRIRHVTLKLLLQFPQMKQHKIGI